MGAKLPHISGKDAVRAFAKVGFVVHDRRGKGSHVVMVREEPRSLLSIPQHRELAPGTLRALIRDADMTVAELVELL